MFRARPGHRHTCTGACRGTADTAVFGEFPEFFILRDQVQSSPARTGIAGRIGARNTGNDIDAAQILNLPGSGLTVDDFRNPRQLKAWIACSGRLRRRDLAGRGSRSRRL